MTVTINKDGIVCLDADEGKALMRKTATGPTSITRVALASSDSPDNWTDCEYAQDIEEEYTEDTPNIYSKLRLKIALAKLGKLQALESWLASFEIVSGYSALAAWGDAQDISDGFEGFQQFYNTALQHLGLTNEQGELILESAKIL